MNTPPTLADMKNHKWDTSKFIKIKTKVVRCKACGKLKIRKESK